MKQPEVKDRFGLVYGILVVLGIGTLLPWNVFITETEFFDVRLHVEPASATVANNYISLFGLAFNSANLVAMCLVFCFQKHLSLRTQVVNPLVLVFIVLASTAALALQLDLPGVSVAYYSLPALAVLGICMAVLQGGLLNLASLFPPIYIQGYIVGCGLSGCATSLLSFLSQLRAPSGADAHAPADVAPAAFLYFAASAGITALCTLSFSLLARLKYSRVKLGPYLASRAAAAAAAAAQAGDLIEQLLPGEPPGMPPSPRKAAANPDALPAYPHHHHLAPPGATQQDYYHAGHADAEEAGLLARDYYLSSQQQQQPGGGGGAPGTGLRETAAYDAAGGAAADATPRGSATFIFYAISIALTMGVSLGVWPGVTAFFCSVDNAATSSPCAPLGRHHSGIWGRLTGDLFVPVTFVAFGVGDLAGRIGSSWGPWGRRPPAAASLLLYALARFGIAGGILVCNVVTPVPWRLPVLVHSDWASLGLIFLLGLTQGHLLSTACMHAPAVVPPGKESEFGPVTGFCITAGCLMGSGALFFIMKFLQEAS